MDVRKAINERRAVRAFSDAEVRPAVVRDLLHAAAQAPSAMNLQPWAFVVVHGRERLTRYSQRAKNYLLGVTEPSFDFDARIDTYVNETAHLFHGAGTLVVVCGRPGRFRPEEACCLAAENLMLAAWGQGLGSCPVGFARPWFNLPEIQQELGIPCDYRAVLPVVLGYPAGPLPPVARDEPEVVAWIWDE